MCDSRQPREAFQTGIFSHLIPSRSTIATPCVPAWSVRAGGSGSSLLESDDDNSNSPTLSTVELIISLFSLPESSLPEQSDGRYSNISRAYAFANFFYIFLLLQCKLKRFKL